MELQECHWIFAAVGCLAETSGFAHAHTVSDASQESAECKVYELVEEEQVALCLQELFLFQQLQHSLMLAYLA